MAVIDPTFKSDRNGRAVPALAPAGTPTKSTLSGTSQALALPTGYTFVEVACTGNFHFAFGSSAVTVTTSGSLFPAGVGQYKVPDSATHLAVIEADAGSDATPITITGLI
jgi:hypothetical protein